MFWMYWIYRMIVLSAVSPLRDFQTLKIQISHQIIHHPANHLPRFYLGHLNNTLKVVHKPVLILKQNVYHIITIFYINITYL